MVGNDGYGYVLVRNSVNVRSGGCGVSGTVSQDVGVKLLRISPVGAVTYTTIYSQHCEHGFSNLTVCDKPPLLGDLVPDGVGVLIRAGYTTQAIATYPRESRLTRVTAEGIQYDIPADFSDLWMTDGAGRAYVSDQSGVRAVDVSNWATAWSEANPSLRPVAPLSEGHVALFNVTTNELTEYDADGTVAQSVASDWYSGHLGNQVAFGLRAAVDGPTGGSLTARVSLPLNEATGGYFQNNAAGTQQLAALPPRRAKEEGAAAVLMLSFLYPMTKASGVEYSGIVCREPGGTSFYWHRIRIGSTVDAGNAAEEFSTEQCADGATTVGLGHTHPTQTVKDPVTNQVFYNWPDEFPSGFESATVYHDVTPNDPGQKPSDLKIADKIFDGAPGWPYKPNVTWYLGSPDLVETPANSGVFQPTGAPTFLRYKKTAQRDSKDNIDRINLSTNTWAPIGPAPWP